MFTDKQIANEERVVFMQEFEKLHSAAEGVEQKLSYYAVFLSQLGMKKIYQTVGFDVGITGGEVVY